MAVKSGTETNHYLGDKTIRTCPEFTPPRIHFSSFFFFDFGVPCDFQEETVSIGTAKSLKSCKDFVRACLFILHSLLSFLLFLPEAPGAKMWGGGGNNLGLAYSGAKIAPISMLC